MQNFAFKKIYSRNEKSLQKFEQEFQVSNGQLNKRNTDVEVLEHTVETRIKGKMDEDCFPRICWCSLGKY